MTALPTEPSRGENYGRAGDGPLSAHDPDLGPGRVYVYPSRGSDRGPCLDLGGDPYPLICHDLYQNRVHVYDDDSPRVSLQAKPHK